MSPELETLDQLLGGDMLLTIIYGLFPNHEHFCKAIVAMVQDGEVYLQATDGTEIPFWSLRLLLMKDITMLEGIRITITDKGAARIA